MVRLEVLLGVAGIVTKPPSKSHRRVVACIAEDDRTQGRVGVADAQHGHGVIDRTSRIGMVDVAHRRRRAAVHSHGRPRGAEGEFSRRERRHGAAGEFDERGLEESAIVGRRGVIVVRPAVGVRGVHEQRRRGDAHGLRHAVRHGLTQAGCRADEVERDPERAAARGVLQHERLGVQILLGAFGRLCPGIVARHRQRIVGGDADGGHTGPP